MPASRSTSRKRIEAELSDEYTMSESSPPRSRRRFASVQSYTTTSDSDGVVVLDSVRKNLKVRPDGDTELPVTITDQSAVFRSSREPYYRGVGGKLFVVDESSVIEGTSAGDNPSSSSKSRRPTEKSLYMNHDRTRKVVIKQEKQGVADLQDPDSIGHNVLRLPRSRRAPVVNVEPDNSGLQFPPTSASEAKNRAVVVRTKPVDERDALHTPSKSGTNTNKLMRFPSPINISSDESDAPTSKAGPAKSDGSPKSKWFRLLCSSAPLRKSKGTTEGQNRKDGLQAPVTAFASSDIFGDLPASTIPLAPKIKDAGIHAQGPRVKTAASTRPSASSSTAEVILEDFVPTMERTSFALVPFGIANGPAGCPAHLLHVNEDGTTSPVELVAGAFKLFEGAAFRSILSAVNFKEFRPFVNVSAAPREQIYAERFKHHVMWQGQNRSVLFTMLGSVQSCKLVEPTIIGQHVYKALTVIPYGEAWRSFQVFLGELYGQGQMRGPFEYGCLLTLSGRREGYSSSMWNPVTPKKNVRAFGSSGTTASSEWYDFKLPNCVDFDQPVPIYDASQKPFLFRREDFVGMPSLPLYKKDGKIADLPVDSIVSVFFAMSSYPKKAVGSSPAAPRSPASYNDILSLNIHFVIYYGVIPHEI